MAPTAAEQLRRVLGVIPRLADGDEHRIADIARLAGVDTKTLMRDLQALAFRYDEPAEMREAVVERLKTSAARI